ncbi:MAG: hypothetical protein KDB53_07380 [Planctomycetes bacterium]|nr:hypothetical protein [Planctomycetota bacterium]
MSEPRESFLPEDVCPALRTKALALNQIYLTTSFEERAESNVAVFHCLKTMVEHGPDGRDALPEACRPGRRCWCGVADPT